MFSTLGVRARFTLAFLCVSAFVALAAAAAIYAFIQTGGALERITLQRVPPTLASLELSREAERVVAAAPALVAVRDWDQQEVLSEAISGQIEHLSELLAQLEGGGTDAKTLEAIANAVDWLSLNFISLDTLVGNQIEYHERKAAALEELREARAVAQRAIDPDLLAREAEIAAWQASLADPEVTDAQRVVLWGKLARSTKAVLALQNIRSNLLEVNEMLLLAATTSAAAEIPVLGARLERSIALLERQVSELEPGQAQALQPQVETVRRLTAGRNNLLDLSKKEIEVKANAERQLLENAQASGELRAAVSQLVGRAKTDIAAATDEAVTTQRVSTIFMIAMVATSLVVSALIIWLYVGRNVIARLTALSSSMLAIAEGDLEAEIPHGGLDEIGRMSDALTVFRDTAIEVRETNLREIQEARRRLTDAIESISEGFSLYDADDRLVLCNTRYSELLYPGLSDVMKPGTPFESVIRTAAERGLVKDAEGDVDGWVAERMERHRNPGEPHEQQRASDLWVRVSERKTEDGNTVAVYTDITTLKHREEELEIARDQAMQAAQAKSQFLAKMSHELRTPLNAVNGFAEVLIDRVNAEGPAPFADPLQRILGAGRHLLSLINEVLDLAKVEAGKMDVSIQPVDVAYLIDETTVTVRPMAEKNDNSIEVTYGNGIGPVLADPVRLRQVLLNLLSNACKFTEHGVISVATTRGRSALGDVIHISVRDTGIGMTSEESETLFTEFTQIESAQTQKFGGTGLGLAISRRLCRLMDGDITVQSAPGKGSTFVVELPLAAEEEERPAAPLVTPPTVREIAPLPTPMEGEGNLILAIDDDPSARELIRLLLEKEGYRVITAADGVEGLRLARSIKPDLIVLDVILPDLDGWSVLAAIKVDEAIRDVPVVIVSIIDEATRGVALGAADYVTKPIDKGRLIRSLARYAGRPEQPAVLVVEDDEAAREMMRPMLEEAGWQVAEAGNGRLALEAMAEHTPDLIILDLMMPEMDGFEFLAVMRDEPLWRHIPVVVITARDLDVQDFKRLNSGVDRIVEKSALSGRELLHEIRSLVAGYLADGRGDGEHKGMRLLYVEDDENNVVLLRARLEQEGFDVYIARDGEEGVAMAGKVRPEIILMDMALPVLDGWQATERLKGMAGTRNIPVIGLSAHAMTGDREKALEAGCDDYDTKPVDMPSLLEKIDKLVGAARAPVS